MPIDTGTTTPRPDEPIARRHTNVLAVIGCLGLVVVVLALLTMVSMRALAQARQVFCYANLNQIGLAAQMYAADHDGILPDAPAWPGKLYPYINNADIVRCPSDYRVSPPRWDGNRISYAMSGACSGVDIDEVASRDTVPLIYDAIAVSGGVDDVDFRHRDGAVCNYMDGHSIWRSSDEWEALWRVPERQ